MYLLPIRMVSEKRFIPGAGRGDRTQKNFIEAFASSSNHASLDLNGMQYKGWERSRELAWNVRMSAKTTGSGSLSESRRRHARRFQYLCQTA